MPRAKSIAIKKHRKIKKQTKGFKHAARKRVKAANEAALHAGQYAYIGRKLKKRDLRKLWIIRLNAAAKEQGLSYSKFISLLKEKKIEIDRKVLSDISVKDPKTFKTIVSKLK